MVRIEGYGARLWTRSGYAVDNANVSDFRRREGSQAPERRLAGTFFWSETSSRSKSAAPSKSL